MDTALRKQEKRAIYVGKRRALLSANGKSDSAIYAAIFRESPAQGKAPASTCPAALAYKGPERSGKRR